MAKQIIENAILLENRPVGADLWLATFKSPQISKYAQPGQFVLIESSQQLFLKRPFSFFEINSVQGTFSIYYQVKGLGTWYMANKWIVNQTIRIQGPHGQGFEITKNSKNILIIAGGIGIAPMKALIDKLNLFKKNYHVIFGGRTEENLKIIFLFQNYNKFLLSTDDGSLGKKQSIIVTLEQYIKENKSDLIYACGPEIVLEKINILALKYNIASQMSYESHMACGVGACMGCSKKINGINKKICTDGPIIKVNY